MVHGMDVRGGKEERGACASFARHGETAPTSLGSARSVRAPSSPGVRTKWKVDSAGLLVNKEGTGRNSRRVLSLGIGLSLRAGEHGARSRTRLGAWGENIWEKKL